MMPEVNFDLFSSFLERDGFFFFFINNFISFFQVLHTLEYIEWFCLQFGLKTAFHTVAHHDQFQIPHISDRLARS